MRFPIHCLFVCCLVVVSRARGNPPLLTAPPAFGVNIHGGSLYTGDLARIRQAGFSWIRTDLMWNNVERKRGIYDFGSFDKLSRELQSQGLHALVILDYGNQQYASNGDSSPFLSRADTPEFRRGYAEFSAAAVSHYSDRGYIWEQWNEPNNKHSWAPAPNPGLYITAMKVACIAIRRENKDAVIIGPATAGVDFDFIEACLKAGMLDYWSGVSIHPYRRNSPNTAARDFAKLTALIAKYAPADRKIPIITSEWGYSTAWSSVDDAKQADDAVELVNFSRTEKVPLTIWYDWRDDGDDPANAEHRFGLVRRSPEGLFVPKPAFRAIRNALSASAPSSE